MKKKLNIRTFQTRPQITEEIDLTLSEVADLLAKVKHSLFAQMQKGKSFHELKTPFLRRFQITARHFNACRVELEGKIASIKERRPGLIAQQKERIVVLEKKIASLQKHRKDPLIIHQKKRRLNLLIHRLEKLEQDHRDKKVRVCFGTRKLFSTQFNLESNGYSDHRQWQKQWKQKRTSEIFFLGSKDESGGNQSCTATVQENGNISLRIRLPDALCPSKSKYLNIPDLHFAYGHQEILAALKQKQAISWRLCKDHKGWTAFASTSVELPQPTSNPKRGVVGLDINANHLALAETDHFGNPIDSFNIPLCLYGKTKYQSKAIILDACKQAVAYAQIHHKPLVIENLDFQKKKSILKENSSLSNSRTLSSFAYSSIIEGINSRASKQGIEVFSVNPAFTSIIGRIKFSDRYGLTIHQAAALCIGRRFLGGSESLPRNLGKIPTGKRDHVALPLPVRNRGEHVWTPWRKINRSLQAALAAHFRRARAHPRTPS